MLVRAAKVASCPEREKYTILLLDEMHVREDLVYDKHTGELVGFASLGDINQHLLAFEQSLSDSNSHDRPLAKTMMVFMVQGLSPSCIFRMCSSHAHLYLVTFSCNYCGKQWGG